MNEKLMVQKTIFSSVTGESDDWPPEDMLSFLAWLYAHIEHIPVEYRATAKIQLSSEWDFDDKSGVCIKISYTCPETDEQFALRLAREEREERDRQARVQFSEFTERQILITLLAKYGPPAVTPID